MASIMLFCAPESGNKACWRLGPDHAEHRRPEQQAADKLTHDRRLADPLRRLAHQPADEEQDPDLERRISSRSLPADPPAARRRMRAVSGGEKCDNGSQNAGRVAAISTPDRVRGQGPALIRSSRNHEINPPCRANNAREGCAIPSPDWGKSFDLSQEGTAKQAGGEEGFEPEALAKRARFFSLLAMSKTNARSGINRGFAIPHLYQPQPMRPLAHGLWLAEREGFEPPIRLPVCRISSAVLSTTQPPLRKALKQA